MNSKLLIIPMVMGLLNSNAFAHEEKKMKGSISDSIQFKKEDKFVAPLFSGTFKVIGIGLLKGQKLEKHQTPTSSFLYIQSGSVLFTLGEKTISLGVGEYFSIPAKELHEVEAGEDSKLMLIK